MDDEIDAERTIENLRGIQECAKWFFEARVGNWSMEGVALTQAEVIVEKARNIGTRFRCRVFSRRGQMGIVHIVINPQFDGDVEVQVEIEGYAVGSYIVPKGATS